MSDGLTIAVMGVVGTLLGAAMGYIVAALTRLNRRLRHLERRDRLSWLYIRSLIDHAYRHNALPLPLPPEGWLDDDNE